MIKIFLTEERYSSKLNFVDDQNVFVGYDFSGQCCEAFGYFISNKQENSEKSADLFLANQKEDTSKNIKRDNDRLKDFIFDKEFFETGSFSEGTSDEYYYAIFRMYSKDNRELFLHIYNIQNGYYSHGFVFSPDPDDVSNKKEGFL